MDTAWRVGATFWAKLDQLAATATPVVDRPRGSAHPDHPQVIYPLDYGYLEGTRSADGAEIDVWLGSAPERGITGVVFTVDGAKRDAELKVLLGCSRAEAEAVFGFHNLGWQAAVLLWR